MLEILDNTNLKIIRRINHILYLVLLVIILIDITLFFSAKVLPIEKVVITGELNTFTNEQITNIVNSEIKGDLFHIDVSRVVSSFKTIPWVDKVEVEKVFPDTVNVNLTPYHAVARYDSYKLLSTSGVIYSGVSKESLPLLISNAEDGRRDIELFSNFNSIFSKHGLKINSLDLATSGIAVINCDSHLQFIFYLENYTSQLQRLDSNWDKIVISPYKKFNFCYKNIVAVA